MAIVKKIVYSMILLIFILVNNNEERLRLSQEVFIINWLYSPGYGGLKLTLNEVDYGLRSALFGS